MNENQANKRITRFASIAKYVEKIIAITHIPTSVGVILEPPNLYLQPAAAFSTIVWVVRYETETKGVEGPAPMLTAQIDPLWAI